MDGVRHEVTPEIQKTEAQWKADLDPERYHILREAGTEAPFTGPLLSVKDDGTYLCGACGTRSSGRTRSSIRTAGGRALRNPRNRKTCAFSTT